MPLAKPTALHCRCAAGVFSALLAATDALAVPQRPGLMDYAGHRVTCQHPVRLTRDCSIWQGATRPIAFGDYRMTLAADDAGSTLLISQLRPGPDHNGHAFRGPSARHGAADAIRRIGATLADNGIQLERMRTMRRGRRVAGYFLEFSGNAYEFLKQFTVLESEYWLPGRGRGR